MSPERVIYGFSSSVWWQIIAWLLNPLKLWLNVTLQDHIESRWIDMFCLNTSHPYARTGPSQFITAATGWITVSMQQLPLSTRRNNMTWGLHNKRHDERLILTSAPSRDFFNTATTSSWKATSSTHFGLLQKHSLFTWIQHVHAHYKLILVSDEGSCLLGLQRFLD